jgi:hypothetical protein
MFVINGISDNQSPETRCFVFESITIARVIADKLQGQGFDVEILDQMGEVVVVDPEPPFTEPY